jgi:hypothetical protein
MSEEKQSTSPRRLPQEVNESFRNCVINGADLKRIYDHMRALGPKPEMEANGHGFDDLSQLPEVVVLSGKTAVESFQISTAIDWQSGLTQSVYMYLSEYTGWTVRGTDALPYLPVVRAVAEVLKPKDMPRHRETHRVGSAVDLSDFPILFKGTVLPPNYTPPKPLGPDEFPEWTEAEKRIAAEDAARKDAGLEVSKPPAEPVMPSRYFGLPVAFWTGFLGWLGGIITMIVKHWLGDK